MALLEDYRNICDMCCCEVADVIEPASCQFPANNLSKNEDACIQRMYVNSLKLNAVFFVSSFPPLAHLLFQKVCAQTCRSWALCHVMLQREWLLAPKCSYNRPTRFSRSPKVLLGGCKFRILFLDIQIFFFFRQTVHQTRLLTFWPEYIIKT